MAEVNPAEVSAILRDQLAGVKNRSRLRRSRYRPLRRRWYCKNLWNVASSIRRAD